MPKGTFVCHVPVKDKADAEALSVQCFSKPFQDKRLKTSFSNIVIKDAVLKDGRWIVTGTFDVEKTDMSVVT